MPRPISIRQARTDDLPSLTALLKTLFAIEEDFVFDETMQRQGLELMLANPHSCVLVAESLGRVVGMCTGQLAVSTAEGGPSVTVEDVVVGEGWRGRGVGRLLLKAVGRWAEDNQAARLQLLADRNNVSALDFYKRLGWEMTQLVCLRQRQ